MSGVRSIGRRGNTVVPNWRWEDPNLDAFDLRVAGWLASHADGYCADYVTRNEIARKTGMSGERARRSLDRLAELGIVVVSEGSGVGGRRLVIEFNHEVWEEKERSPDDRKVVATRPQGGRQATTEREQGEKQEELPQAGAVSELRAQFDEWYSLYPRKVGRGTAWAAYKKARRRGVSQEGLVAGLHRSRANWERQKTSAEFIPHPSSWLNGERYLDGEALAAEATGRKVWVSHDVSGPPAEGDRNRHGDMYLNGVWVTR